jgi:hypothetical protein
MIDLHGHTVAKDFTSQRDIYTPPKHSPELTQHTDNLLQDVPFRKRRNLHAAKCPKIWLHYKNRAPKFPGLLDTS